jgi:hypothetical protein
MSVVDDLKARAAAQLKEQQGDGVVRQELVPLTDVQKPVSVVLEQTATGPTNAVLAASEGEKRADELRHSRTFVHQTAGANTILPDGKKLTFGGRPHLASIGMVGGLGFYVTNDPVEIKWLETLVKMHGSQVTELVEDPTSHREALIAKQADPAIQQSAQDAARNSERVFNPQASAAVENLGAHIASGHQADAQRQQ